MEKKPKTFESPDNPITLKRGSKHAFTMYELMEAIKTTEKKKKKKFFQHFVERAYENDKVLCVLIDKFIPDIRPIVNGGEDDDLKDQELGFLDVPANGDGLIKFKRYLN